MIWAYLISFVAKRIEPVQNRIYKYGQRVITSKSDETPKIRFANKPQVINLLKYDRDGQPIDEVSYPHRGNGIAYSHARPEERTQPGQPEIGGELN